MSYENIPLNNKNRPQTARGRDDGQEHHGEEQSKINAMQQTWGSLTKLLQDRHTWKKLVAALHTTSVKDDDLHFKTNLGR
jgi:hypothetical protein